MPVLSMANKTISRSMLVGNSPYIPTSFESIATITATGGETSVSFTSIPTGYSHLQIRAYAADSYISGASPSAGTTDIQFNGDTTSNYAQWRLYGDGSVTVYGAGNANTARVGTCIGTSWGGGSQNFFSPSVTDIFDYASTTKTKSVKGYTGVRDNSSSTNWQQNYGTGIWYSTAAINRIDIICAISGWRAGSIFALYGVK